MADAATYTYPYTKYRYWVKIDEGEAAGFSEVSAVEVSIDTQEYREGNMAPTPKKVAGLRKYSNITLKKGITDSQLIYEWISGALEGDITRKNLTISLLDATGATEVATWSIVNAWPVKYSSTDFSASSSDIAIETLELAHEGMTRTK